MVEDKAAVMEKLRARGIMTVDFWRYFHPSCDPREFPEVADLRRRVLEIPCHQDLSPETMARIADAIRDAMPRRQPRRVSV
jgi:dTDP-4-amino-4,6-dideoxygalactose transaminase